MAEKIKSYTEAVTRLRQIVSEIEQGELDVDILSDRVKEASRLLRICKENYIR